MSNNVKRSFVQVPPGPGSGSTPSSTANLVTQATAQDNPQLLAGLAKDGIEILDDRGTWNDFDQAKKKFEAGTLRLACIDPATSDFTHVIPNNIFESKGDVRHITHGRHVSMKFTGDTKFVALDGNTKQVFADRKPTTTTLNKMVNTTHIKLKPTHKIGKELIPSYQYRVHSYAANGLRIEDSWETLLAVVPDLIENFHEFCGKDSELKKNWNTLPFEAPRLPENSVNNDPAATGLPDEEEQIPLTLSNESATGLPEDSTLPDESNLPEKPVNNEATKCLDKKTAIQSFYWLHGFWLGDGTLETRNPEGNCLRVYVAFSNNKDSDLDLIEQHLKILGFKEGVDYTCFTYDQRAGGPSTVFRIKNKAWTRFYAENFGFKYKQIAALKKNTRCTTYDGKDLRQISYDICKKNHPELFDENGNVRSDVKLAHVKTEADDGAVKLADVKTEADDGAVKLADVKTEADDGAVKLADVKKEADDGASDDDELPPPDIDELFPDDDESVDSEDDELMDDDDRKILFEVVSKVKSAKWMLDWFWKLPMCYADTILRGLSEADGRSSSCQSRMSGKDSDTTNLVYTSSVKFRDQCVALAIHAGRAAYYVLGRAKGETCMILHKKKTSARSKNVKAKTSRSKKTDDSKFHVAEAKTDAWVVHYSIPSGCGKNSSLFERGELLSAEPTSTDTWGVELPVGCSGFLITRCVCPALKKSFLPVFVAGSNK